MVMITIVMMMRLLSGTMVIKTQGPERKNRRKVNAYCLTYINMVGLVHVRRREKTDRKIVEVTGSYI